jgi:hypothetical protein
MRPTLAARTGMHKATKLDRLEAECFRERSIVAAPLADHCLGCVALEEELDDLFGLGADDAGEEHVVRISSCAWIGPNLQKGATRGRGAAAAPPPATPNAP